MGGQNINITYETLFDLFRNERKEPIQELPESFYADLVAYLQEKTSQMAKGAEGDAERITKQLQNIHKLVRDIYEMRERKIVNLALVAARSPQVNTDNLLPPELELFDEVVERIKQSRHEVLASLLKGEMPSRQSVMKPTQAPACEAEDSDCTLVQFEAYVPKFVGTELEVYGPFEPGDMANLPKEIAEVLISKGRASVVS